MAIAAAAERETERETERERERERERGTEGRRDGGTEGRRDRGSGEVEASIKMKPAITTGTNIGIIVHLDNAFGYKNISLSMS